MEQLEEELGLEVGEEELVEEGVVEWGSGGTEQPDPTRLSPGMPFSAPTLAPTEAEQPPPSPPCPGGCI